MNKFFASEEFQKYFRGNVKEREPMKNHTTMNVGGLCPFFIEPENEESLVFLLRSLRKLNVRFFILGGGSNTILPDEIDFPIVSTRKIENNFVLENGILKCGSGSSWGGLISFCRKNNISGFEPFTGLSGTVGGAIFMNATCFGLTTSDRLISVRYLDLNDFEIKTYSKNESDWGYKKSPFHNEMKTCILSAEFSISDEEFDIQKSEEVLQKRKAMGHFNAPSSGSVFKNDPENGIIAGKIIDECGLKGKKIGGAQIAPFHGNFIINPDRNATAKDIRNLVEFVKTEVKEKKGIQLKEEILFV